MEEPLNLPPGIQADLAWFLKQCPRTGPPELVNMINALWERRNTCSEEEVERIDRDMLITVLASRGVLATFNMGADNLNNRRYYVTGKTFMKEGRLVIWDAWYADPPALGVPIDSDGNIITHLTCTDYADTVPHTMKPTTGADALHLWWSLSYAQYLTIPRSVMQSMPDEWQAKMSELLRELDDRIDWRPAEGSYWCFLRGADGKFTFDPLADYQRGRRRIRLKDQQQDAE